MARTACSIDERLQLAVEDLEAKDLALRSYINEQREQVAEMSQNQQNQILSLMELVKQDVADPNEKSQYDGLSRSGDAFDETLLVLANERISLLETQLEDTEAEAAVAKSYRSELEESKGALQKLQGEREFLETELQKAYSAMSRIKAMLSRPSGRGGAELSRVIAQLDSALGNSDGSAKAKKPTTHPLDKAGPLPAALKDAIDFDESDPDDGQTIEPDWANDIMDDLALIAEGKLPPSLKGTVKLEERTEVPVFERLADPENYTGTQRQARLRYKTRSKGNAAVNGQFDAAPGEKDDRLGHDDSPRTRQIGDGDDRSRHKEKPPPTARNRPLAKGGSFQRPGETKSTFNRTSSLDYRPSRKVGNPRSSRGDENSGSKIPTTRDRHRSDPGEENVFERLSTQTTFAFSVRQNGVPDEEDDQQHHHHHHQAPRMTSVDALLEEVLGSSPYNGHSSPDVFERLTKTTTEAFAMKVNRARDD